MTAPQFQAPGDKALADGVADLRDLEAILADDSDIASHRQAIADRQSAVGSGPVMLSLARLAGLTEQIEVEVRFIRRHLGGAL